jgi:stress-induced morphogen
MLRVTDAEYLDGFRIRLVFSDGTAGTVDLRGRMEGPIFQALNDAETFRQFELTDHTLVWPNGADFAPEYLHDLLTQTVVMINSNNSEDTQVQQIRGVLSQYEREHPSAQIDVRRQNAVSIRIRIIDPDFSGLDRVDREPAVWSVLKRLPDDVFTNITMLLLLSPDETEGSLANQEFEDPIPSRL